MALVTTRRHLERQLASIAAAAGAGGVATAAIAGETADLPSLPQPIGKPVLTISGRIAVANQGNTARFDRAMLEALGTSGFETTTPWYDGPVRFEGVRMSHLMDVVGASGDRVM